MFSAVNASIGNETGRAMSNVIRRYVNLRTFMFFASITNIETETTQDLRPRRVTRGMPCR